jgi:uroporphyrin-3 C-methyltransferase
LNELERSLVTRLSEVVNQGPPSQREWKLAEVEYLLRIANHRVLMERDVAAASDLLAAADQVLNELDDFSLHQVRAQLADEMVALAQVPRSDVQGLFLRMEAVKALLRDLKHDRPAYLSETPPVEQDEIPWRDALVAEARSLFRFNDMSEGIKPLLSPDESAYLELNLRLKLEQAQLAVLKGDQVVFDESIESAVDMMLDHFDQSDSNVLAVISQMQEIGSAHISADLPDISGSLNTLLRSRRGNQ